MILKRLTATGFKSFADKTEFDFGPGVTCIVGPNGCGKSNVVDAIKWVLGEQSAKSLRGRQMLDVIFNGSGTRKSSGMAQVDLTFDNSDRTLSIDQDEIVVSRRLYRSGDSEYLLNQQVCRLKDVRELFLDTGIGVDAYSVIEQGRVDIMLQANPVDRRLIFEEAAGISKYKVRKKEAIRRLDRVEQNVLRVQDVVEEVEKRLRSVKLAAGKARNYQAYRQRLSELRSRYALAEYHRYRAAQGSLEAETSELSDRITARRTELADNETRTSQAQVRIVEFERDLGEVESALLTAQSEKTGQEERIASSQRRIEDQETILARSAERLGEMDQRLAELDERLEAQRRESEAVEADLGQAQTDLAVAQERDKKLALDLHEAKTRLEDEKSGVLELLRRTSRLQNEIQSLTVQHESLHRQKGKLDEREAQVAERLAEAMGLRDRLLARRDEIDDLLRRQTEKLEEIRSKMSQAESRRSVLFDQMTAAREYRGGLESRRQLLEEMDRRHEGLLAGARDVLQRRDADETGRTFRYVRGAVGELFEAEVAHASIVEAVLGDHQNFLVVARRDALLADRDQFADLSGRVHAFCLDAIPPAVSGPDLSEQEGYITQLLDWVRYPDECALLARYLLGRTYVVESMEDARRLSDLDPAARFVTMDGIVWGADGRIGVGSLGSDSGLISRRSELRELGRELEEIAERIARLEGEQAEVAAEFGHLETVQQELRKANYDTNAERVDTAARLDAIERDVQRLGDEQPLLAAEAAMLADQMGKMRDEEAASRDTLTGLEQQSEEGERQVTGLQARIEALERERSESAEAMTAVRVRVGELSQRRTAAGQALREMETSRIHLQAERGKAESDVDEARSRITHSREQMEEARQRQSVLAEQVEQLTGRARGLRDERDATHATVDRLSGEARHLRGELDSLEADLHEREMKLQEARVRAEDLVARIAEELSVDLVGQYKGYEPDGQEDWPAVEAEIEALRQKIERLGNVNLDSITEQEELEQRLTFLTSQLDDLRESRRQLEELIDKLNRESEQRFLETFRAVQGHFAALFKKLFGGGKAELALQDENDVLECGIEVMARPPGKEPQGIGLLSGGEKTLTAIALLMAVMRSRPSPFVLLDEVDAALDEANNTRFNHVLREFARDSQFVVITHSKRTMTIGDVMYGVTMQEAGVSKRVSVRFEEERAPRQAVA